MIIYLKNFLKRSFLSESFFKDNSNTFSQMIILASIPFVFVDPLGMIIEILLGKNLDKNKN